MIYPLTQGLVSFFSFKAVVCKNGVVSKQSIKLIKFEKQSLIPKITVSATKFSDIFVIMLSSIKKSFVILAGL